MKQEKKKCSSKLKNLQCFITKVSCIICYDEHGTMALYDVSFTKNTIITNSSAEFITTLF
jgi:hypothetical protein